MLGSEAHRLSHGVDYTLCRFKRAESSNEQVLMFHIPILNKALFWIIFLNLTSSRFGWSGREH